MTFNRAAAASRTSHDRYLPEQSGSSQEQRP